MITAGRTFSIKVCSSALGNRDSYLRAGCKSRGKIVEELIISNLLHTSSSLVLFMLTDGTKFKGPTFNVMGIQ